MDFVSYAFSGVKSYLLFIYEFFKVLIVVNCRRYRFKIIIVKIIHKETVV